MDNPLTRCWFCGREVALDYLIAGYDTWDEQRLACLDCDRTIHALREKGWLDAARAPSASEDAHGEGWPNSCPTCRRWFGASASEDVGLRAALKEAVRILSGGQPGYVGDHYIRSIQVNQATVDRLRAALRAASPTPGLRECSDCDGRGFTKTANPLPSGEPGEPYQLPCPTCNTLGMVSAASPTPETPQETP